MKTPNDPKLSDGGGWRGPCLVGGKAAAEARAVTAGAVRCSAWLGASFVARGSKERVLKVSASMLRPRAVSWNVVKRQGHKRADKGEDKADADTTGHRHGRTVASNEHGGSDDREEHPKDSGDTGKYK